MLWFALKTKPNCEKKAAEKLRVMQMEGNCPVKIEFKHWSDRKKKVAEPLLPSMILVNCKGAERNLVFNEVNIKI